MASDYVACDNSLAEANTTYSTTPPPRPPRASAKVRSARHTGESDYTKMRDGRAKLFVGVERGSKTGILIGKLKWQAAT